MDLKMAIWALLLLAAAPFSYGSEAEAFHIRDKDIGIVVDGGRVLSTECTDAQGPINLRRKLAIAMAGRSIVKKRDGVVISGYEHLDGKKLSLEINEDSIGLVKPLIVIAEDDLGGDSGKQLCVTVIEDDDQKKIGN